MIWTHENEKGSSNHSRGEETTPSNIKRFSQSYYIRLGIREKKGKILFEIKTFVEI